MISRTSCVCDGAQSLSESFREFQLMKMKVMKVMKVWELLLILSCVSADIIHDDLAVTGCSESDGEDMYALDGEEVYYADFTNKRGVYPQPDFIDPINYGEGTFQNSQAQLEICKQNMKVAQEAYKNIPLKFDPPSSPMIYPKDDVEFGVQNTLICHVTGFFPAPIKVSWTKNGQKVTEGTSINVPYINTDGSYRQSSRLEFIPQQGDIYRCGVTHPALTEPLTRMWDVEGHQQQPGVGPAVFCGLGLTVGLLGVAAGTFFLIKGNECS